jgi:hypothetical protein
MYINIYTFSDLKTTYDVFYNNALVHILFYLKTL